MMIVEEESEESVGYFIPFMSVVASTANHQSRKVNSHV